MMAMLGRAMMAGGRGHAHAAMMFDDEEGGDEDEGDHAMTAEMEAFMQGGENKPKIPHPAVLASLLRVIVTKDHPPGEPCSICQDVPEAGQETVQLPCEHRFHGQCLEPWFKDHNSCPSCRSELPTIEELE
jgi:hypothetical protein